MRKKCTDTQQVISIRRGLDLPISGLAEKRIVDMRYSVDLFAVKPTDVVGFTPRLMVAEGDSVAAGQPVLCDKNNSKVTLSSPVDGTVSAIVRGEKRALLEVQIKRNASANVNADEKKSSVIPVAEHTSATAKQMLIDAGAWWMLRERPFGAIANPDREPKAIFVSLFDTNPLAPSLSFVLKDRKDDLKNGFALLSKMAKVNVGVSIADKQQFRYLENMPNVQLHYFEGPHPAGNIGTQIAKVSPINKGEIVWFVGAQDVATIGKLAITGIYCPERVVTVAGPAAKSPHYYYLTVGSNVETIVASQVSNNTYPALQEGSNTRVVSGSLLSGVQIRHDGFLSLYDQQLSFIEEGDQYEFLGWITPGLKKHSFSRAFLSGIVHDTMPCVEKTNYVPVNHFTTNTHGSKRPLLFTGQFERVFPLDIYPLQLLKACITSNLELMEQLGIYEVEPEDFALCEYIDPSKTEIQTIVRAALEMLRKEAM